MHQPVLHIDRALSWTRDRVLIVALRLKDIRKLIITQIHIQYSFNDLADVLRVFEREYQFHATVEIALHEIGGTQVDLFLPTVEKVKDTAMDRKSTRLNSSHVAI